MKTRSIFLLAFLTLLAAPQVLAMRWCSLNTGRWFSRDPIGERGGLNLYGLVKNNPVSATDSLGLADYHIQDLDPTGLWMLRLADVNVYDDTFKGFHSRYLPSDGKIGQPPCPCKKENIFLVQAVEDPLGHPDHFDVDPLAPHGPGVPIPGYYTGWNSPVGDPLTIVDAPNFPRSPNWSGSWRFEDCAVCRTRPNANSVDDQVLGCVKFVFHRTDQNTAELSVESGGSLLTGHKLYILEAERPGRLWNKALQNWQQ
jgi:hypothetical protein